MSTIIQETVESGGEDVEIRVEVDDSTPHGHLGTHKARRSAESLSGGDTPDITAASNVFSQGMRLIRACAEQVSETVGKVSETARPQQVEVKFGVKLTGQTGALLVKAGTEAHMEVALTWQEKEEKTPPD